MPADHLWKIAFLLTWKRFRTSKIGTVLYAALPVLFLYLSFRESVETAMKVFLYLFPHFFLFLSGGGMKDEVQSGVLENVLFSGGRFKEYLCKKTWVLGILAFIYGSILFAAIMVPGFAPGRFFWVYLLQFLMGGLAGLYYLYLGSLLGFSLKAGSNVLALLLAQVSIFIGLLFSVTRRGGFFDGLENGVFPDFLSQLKFLALVAICPNLIILRKLWLYSAEVAFLLALVLIIQSQRIRRLELRK